VCLVKAFTHCRKKSKKIKTEELHSKRKTIILIAPLDSWPFKRIKSEKKRCQHLTADPKMCNALTVEAFIREAVNEISAAGPIFHYTILCQITPLRGKILRKAAKNSNIKFHLF